MPKAKVVTKPEPDDAIHKILANHGLHRCDNPNCKQIVKAGRIAWWDHRDKKVYCGRECVEWRLGEEGTKEAVLGKLLGS